MENLPSARSPEEVAAEVAAKLEKERADKAAKDRAGTLDASPGSDGELFLALIRKMKAASRSSATPHRKRQIEATNTELTLRFYPKPGKEPVELAMPDSSEVIRHPGNVYVLSDQRSMRQIRVEERHKQIHFVGCSGFEISHKRALRRLSHGTHIVARVGRS